MTSAEDWAAAEFGDVDLGDERRGRRLVNLATEAALHPAGTVTKACGSSASREGAFRLLENSSVRYEPILGGVTRATLKRCRELQRVYVPIDGTTLRITDKKQNKGFGAVGAWSLPVRGVHAMTALAVDADGAPVGICGQTMWSREKPSKRGGGSAEGKESKYWLELLRDCHAAFAADAPQCEPWYQLDRGGDYWGVLTIARELGLLLTVRAAYDRRLDGEKDALWAAVGRTRVLGYLRVKVPARLPRKKRRRTPGRRDWRAIPARPARVAKVAVRAATVPLALTLPTGKTVVVEFNAVFAIEVGATADDRIEWMLLTTHPVRTRRDALAVVHGYALRWRVEDFHRTWKRGHCRIEDTQLRSPNAVFKWATILAAVATRSMRLTHLARTEPDTLATAHLSRVELDALITLRQPKGISLGHVPSLGQAVRWIADLGGYTGPWNGPPGPTIVGRGLHTVLIAARAFENRDKMR